MDNVHSLEKQSGLLYTGLPAPISWVYAIVSDMGGSAVGGFDDGDTTVMRLYQPDELRWETCGTCALVQ